MGTKRKIEIANGKEQTSDLNQTSGEKRFESAKVWRRLSSTKPMVRREKTVSEQANERTDSCSLIRPNITSERNPRFRPYKLTF